MQWEIARRRFLQTGIGSSLPLTGSPNHRSKQPSTVVEGYVRKLNEQPVRNATVRLYTPTSADPVQVAQTSTTGEGYFEVTLAQDLDSVLITCSKEDWFRARVIQTDESQDIVLNRQLLFGPELAEDDDEPIAEVSIWRQIGPDSTEQVLYMEFTNARRATSAPVNDIYDTGYDLSNGLFTLEFPEDKIVVDYGPSTDIEIFTGTPIQVRGAPSPMGDIGTHPSERIEREIGPLSTLHPEVTSLPAYETTQQLVEFRDLIQPGEQAETYKQGIGRILGGLPHIGSLVAWADSIKWAFGDPAKASAHLGQAESAIPSRDPNKVDTIAKGWESPRSFLQDDLNAEEAAVVMSVPIRFTTDSAQTLIARAECEKKTWHGFGRSHASFSTEFTIDPAPVSTEGSQTTSDRTTDWPMVGGGPANQGTNHGTESLTNRVTEKWRFETESNVRYSPVVVDNTVYVATINGSLYGLDSDTGEPVWDQPFQTDSVIRSPAVIDNAIYFGSGAKNVYALDTKTGEPIWNQPFSTEGTPTSPTVVDNTVYVGDNAGSVFAVDAAMGEPVWDQPFQTKGQPTHPAVVDGTVYIGSRDGNVYSLDATTGEPIWNPPFQMEGIPTSPTVVGSTVYVGRGFAIGLEESKDLVYTLDAETGEPVWDQPLQKAGPTGNPTVVKDTVYVGMGGTGRSSKGAANNPGELYALDASTGKMTWDRPFETNGRPTNPAVVNDIIYVSCRSGNIYALNAKTGKLAWNHPFQINGALTNLAVADGGIYVGSDNNNLYALQ